jgi:hypothetical protein
MASSAKRLWFAANISRLQDIGYASIPRHYEEALILFEGLTRQNPVPAGYRISDATRERFHQYAGIFAQNRYDMNKAANALHRDFGDTYWFYMQFAPDSPQDIRTKQ